MAIAIEHVDSSIGGSDRTLSMTTQTGEIVVACIGIHQGTVNGVTWNGNAMTQGPNADTAYHERAEIWYDLSPDIGAYNLVFDGTGGGGRFLCGLIISGVKTTGQPDQTNTATGSDDSIECSVTPSTADSLIIDSVYSEAALSSADSGQTIQANLQDNGYENGGCSTHYPASAAAREMGWDTSSGQRWASAVISFEPAGGAATVVQDLLGSGIIPFAR